MDQSCRYTAVFSYFFIQRVFSEFYQNSHRKHKYYENMIRKLKKSLETTLEKDFSCTLSTFIKITHNFATSYSISLYKKSILVPKKIWGKLI